MTYGARNWINKNEKNSIMPVLCFQNWPGAAFRHCYVHANTQGKNAIHSVISYISLGVYLFAVILILFWQILTYALWVMQISKANNAHFCLWKWSFYSCFKLLISGKEKAFYLTSYVIDKLIKVKMFIEK